MDLSWRANRAAYTAAGILLLVAAGLVVLRGLSGEDAWICQNGEWVAHGKPYAPKPVGPCGTTAIPDSDLAISSSAFDWGKRIPEKYTCDGDNVNPSLVVSGVPGSTATLALIMDDPDAPSGTFTHWTWWNASPSLVEIDEDSVPEGAVLGSTSAGAAGYVGPCPPTGRHQYRFQLYALDAVLDLPQDATRAELEQAMNGHVIGAASYIGLYSR